MHGRVLNGMRLNLSQQHPFFGPSFGMDRFNGNLNCSNKSHRCNIAIILLDLGRQN